MNGLQVNILRQKVEWELCAILRDEYGLNVEADTPVRYYLDFKTDRRLLELQDVLERMDGGTFGICMVCGELISDAHLVDSPVVRLCDACIPAAHGAINASARDRIRAVPVQAAGS